MFNIETSDDGVFSIKVSGKLTHSDYKDHLIPVLEGLIERYKKVNLLIEAEGFHGWEWRAAFDDFKTAVKHRKEFGRIAIVGDRQWQENLCKLFGFMVAGEVRYFQHDALAQAKEWVRAK